MYATKGNISISPSKYLKFYVKFVYQCYFLLHLKNESLSDWWYRRNKQYLNELISISLKANNYSTPESVYQKPYFISSPIHIAITKCHCFYLLNVKRFVPFSFLTTFILAYNPSSLDALSMIPAPSCFEVGSHYVVIASLKLSVWPGCHQTHRNPLSSASGRQGLKQCATALASHSF